MIDVVVSLLICVFAIVIWTFIIIHTYRDRKFNKIFEEMYRKLPHEIDSKTSGEFALTLKDSVVTGNFNCGTCNRPSFYESINGYKALCCPHCLSVYVFDTTIAARLIEVPGELRTVTGK